MQIFRHAQAPIQVMAPSPQVAQVATRETVPSTSRAQSGHSVQALQVGSEVSIGHYTFRITDLLGRGNQGCVWAATQTDGSAQVAIKETLCNSESELVAAKREPVLMQAIVEEASRCCNILATPDVVACEIASTKSGAKAVRFAMTKIPGEPLSTFLHTFAQAASNANASFASRYFDEAHRFTLAMLSQLVAAFHSISAVALHRDISTENLIVSVSKGVANPEFAIIDFGLAVQSEAWPTLMHKVSVVGNCHYWPPSAWFLFMCGGSELLAQEAMRMEYLTQLDLHSVGILGVQVLMEMLPRSVLTYLPGEMLTLSRVWDQYWETIDCYNRQMHRAQSGEVSWSTLRQLYIAEGIHRIIDSTLARLHDALEKVSRHCETAALNSPLSIAGPLFKALTELISHGCTEGRSSKTSWFRVQAILGGKSLSSTALTMQAAPRLKSLMPTTYSNTTSPVNTGYTNVDSSFKVTVAPRQQRKLVTSKTVIAPVPRTVAPEPEPKAEQACSTFMVDKTKCQSLLVEGAIGANAEVINGVYDVSGTHNDMPSWQKRSNSSYVLVMMSNRWWVTDSDSKAANKITGWAKSSKAEWPTSAASWQVWDGREWDSQSIIVSEATLAPPVPEIVTPVRDRPVSQMLSPIEKTEKVTTVIQEQKVEKPRLIQEQIVEKPTSVVQVRVKDVPIPAIGTAEKTKVALLKASKHN